MRALAALLSLACCACLGVPGDKLARLDRGELEREARLPAVSYQCNPGPPGPGRRPTKIVGWPSVENEALFRSAFADARFASGAVAGELHIDLLLQAQPHDPDLRTASWLLCVGTLGILPGHWVEDLTLRARVEQEGELLREYSYADETSTWSEVLLVFWMLWHDPFETRNEVFDNLLLHFLRDLRRDLPALVPKPKEP